MHCEEHRHFGPDPKNETLTVKALAVVYLAVITAFWLGLFYFVIKAIRAL